MIKKKMAIPIFIFIIVTIVALLIICKLLSDDLLLVRQLYPTDREIMGISVMSSNRNYTSVKLTGKLYDDYSDAYKKLKIRPLTDKEDETREGTFGEMVHVLSYRFVDDTVMQICVPYFYKEDPWIS